MFADKKVIVFWVVFAITEVHLLKFEGDKCELSDKSQGKCLIIHDCPGAAVKLIWGMNPGTCGFKGKEPLVCCGTTEEPDSKETLLKFSRESLEETREEICEKMSPSLVDFVDIRLGKSSPLTDFPHMVALGTGDKENIEWKCGGSLISERFVLTAAYCRNNLYQPKFARMGVVDLESSSEDVQNFLITRFISHPDYKPPIFYHNIALVELDKPAVFTVHVKPACLYTQSDIPQLPLIETYLRLTENSGKVSTTIQQVEIFYNNSACNAFKSVSKRKLPNGILEDQLICTDSGKQEDTCVLKIETGVPLQINSRKDGFYTIVGIGSFGQLCSIVSAHTRVSYYVPWIKSIVWP